MNFVYAILVVIKFFTGIPVNSLPSKVKSTVTIIDDKLPYVRDLRFIAK